MGRADRSDADALIDFSAGRVQKPVRRFLTVDRYEGFFGIMPAVSETVMGIKLVTFYPHNAARGVPTHLAMMQLCASETGEALALIDGRLITEMRTAAMSAAATKMLAAPDARVLAILGSGVQARARIEALRHARDFDEIGSGAARARARRTLRRRGRRLPDTTDIGLGGAGEAVSCRRKCGLAKVPMIV